MPVDVPKALPDGTTAGRGPTLDDVFAAASHKASSSASTTGWLGDPCAGIGEGWDAATATALGLLAAVGESRGRYCPVLISRAPARRARASRWKFTGVASMTRVAISARNRSGLRSSGTRSHGRWTGGRLSSASSTSV